LTLSDLHGKRFDTKATKTTKTTKVTENKWLHGLGELGDLCVPVVNVLRLFQKK
jgi:hypothetical protein